MKIPLTYGTFMAVAAATVTLVLFLLGYHADAQKLTSAQTLMIIAGIGINVAGITLGIRARRAQVPLDHAFTYGRALGTGVMISVVAAILGAAFNVLYSTVINTGFIDVMMEQQTAKLEARGMSSDQVEKATRVGRWLFKPGIQFVFTVVIGVFWGLIISLITAAFLKRESQVVAPPPLPSS